MPQPSMSQVHVNRPLTNISVAYMQQAQNFIADKVFPPVPVAKQSDRYFVYSISDFYRADAQLRAPATESAGSGYNLDNTPSYYAPVFALHKDVDDQTRANADDPLNMDRDATEFVTQQMMLKRELVWTTNNFKTGVWGTDTSPSTKWDNAASTPIEDITGAGINVAGATGFKPNTLVLSPRVYNALRNHPDVLDRIKYTMGGAVATPQLLAQLLDVDRVLVPFAVVNSANEGATDSIDFIYGENALLTYAAPRPSIMVPSGGYNFTWTGLLGAGATGIRIKSFRMEHLSADRIEGEIAYDPKVVAPSLGVFFNNTLT